ncbi:MAG: hypothetical protein PHT69_02260 [Bacteroidales bacterium]|nr:hypothetical protein [Bacteroidales bacterium]
MKKNNHKTIEQLGYTRNQIADISDMSGIDTDNVLCVLSLASKIKKQPKLDKSLNNYRLKLAEKVKIEKTEISHGLLQFLTDIVYETKLTDVERAEVILKIREIFEKGLYVNNIITRYFLNYHIRFIKDEWINTLNTELNDIATLYKQVAINSASKHESPEIVAQKVVEDYILKFNPDLMSIKLPKQEH